MRELATLDQSLPQYQAAVRSLALRLVRRSASYAPDLEDLMQEGMVGIFSAAQRYEPEMGAAFFTFVWRRAEGAMRDAVRQADPLGRDLRRQVRAIEAAVAAQPDSLPADIAGALNLSVDQVFAAQRISHHGTLDTLDKPGPGSTTDRVHLVPCSRPGPHEQVLATEVRRALNAAIRQLRTRDRSILRLYYIEEIPLKAIGYRFGITESRVSQILTRIHGSLRKTLAPPAEFARNRTAVA